MPPEVYQELHERYERTVYEQRKLNDIKSEQKKKKVSALDKKNENRLKVVDILIARNKEKIANGQDPKGTHVYHLHELEREKELLEAQLAK